MSFTLHAHKKINAILILLAASFLINILLYNYSKLSVNNIVSVDILAKIIGTELSHDDYITSDIRSLLYSLTQCRNQTFTIFITNICGVIGYDLVRALAHNENNCNEINIIGYDSLNTGSYDDKLKHLREIKEIVHSLKRSRNSHANVDIIDIIKFDLCSDERHLKYIYNKYNFTHIIINNEYYFNDLKDVSCFNVYLKHIDSAMVNNVVYTAYKNNPNNLLYKTSAQQYKYNITDIILNVTNDPPLDQSPTPMTSNKTLIMNLMINPSRISDVTQHVSLKAMSTGFNHSLANYGGARWNISIISDWYNSFMKHVDKTIYDYDIVLFSTDIVFNDCDIGRCNLTFIDILFYDVTYDFVYNIAAKGISPYDARFIWFYDFMLKHRDNYKFVLISDLFDVTFGGNPLFYTHALLKDYAKDIIVGKEKNMWHWVPWIAEQMKQCYGWDIYSKKAIMQTHGLYNYGSGFVSHINLSIKIFKMIIEELEIRPIKSNCAFSIFPWIINQLIDKKRVNDTTPKQWSSPFKKYKDHRKDRFVIYHKR